MSKVGLRQQEVRYLVSTDTVTVWRQFCLSAFSEAAHIRVCLSTKCYPTLHSISLLGLFHWQENCGGRHLWAACEKNLSVIHCSPTHSHWHQWFQQGNQQFCDSELVLWDELRECISPFSIFTFGWKAPWSSSVSLPETQERKFGKRIKNNFSKSHSTVPHLLVFNSLLHTVSDCCALSALWLRHQPKPWASVTSEEQEVPLQ